ncbi:hypothetical protein pb186bvf_001359 [Paramecium bursaria]
MMSITRGLPDIIFFCHLINFQSDFQTNQENKNNKNKFEISPKPYIISLTKEFQYIRWVQENIQSKQLELIMI